MLSPPHNYKINKDGISRNKVSFGTEAIETMKKLQEQNERIREKIK